MSDKTVNVKRNTSERPLETPHKFEICSRPLKKLQESLGSKI